MLRLLILALGVFMCAVEEHKGKKRQPFYLRRNSKGGRESKHKQAASFVFMNDSGYFRQFLDCGNNRIDIWEEALACHLQNPRTCLDGRRRIESYGEHSTNHIKLSHHLFQHRASTLCEALLQSVSTILFRLQCNWSYQYVSLILL